MACRYRQHKTYRNLRPGFREQIQVAAEIFRRTSLPHSCLSPANQCDRSNASSFSDSQLLRVTIQSFPGNTGFQRASSSGHVEACSTEQARRSDSVPWRTKCLSYATFTRRLAVNTHDTRSV